MADQQNQVRGEWKGQRFPAEISMTFSVTDAFQNNCHQRQRRFREPAGHLRREEEDDTSDGKGGEPEGNAF